MSKILFTISLLMLGYTPLFFPTPEAQAMNVKCNDPQTERGKVRTQRETIRYQDGNIVERERTGFDYKGQELKAPIARPIERDENYEPKPIKKGSNLHECIN